MTIVAATNTGSGGRPDAPDFPDFMDEIITYFMRFVNISYEAAGLRRLDKRHFRCIIARMTEAPQAGSQSIRTANILAIVGFIIIGVVVVWGLIHLAFLTGPWVSSLFGGTNGNEIAVTTPASAVSGQPTTVHWQYSAPSTGTYALLFTCASDLKVAVLAPDNSLQPVPCGAAFTVAPAQSGNASTTIRIVPFLAASSSEKTTLSILFIPNTASSTGPTASGSAPITVTPGTGVAPNGTGTGNNGGSTIIPVPVGGGSSNTSGGTPTTGTGTGGTGTGTSKPSGTSGTHTTTGTNPKPIVHTPVDLRVTILSLTADQYGNGTAVFDIANIGGTSSGTYYFSATLPTAQPYAYSSPAQASLTPGSHVVSTLHFTQAITGAFTVTVDPGNYVHESNESNNSASQTLSAPVPYNSYQGYNDYNAYQNYNNSYNQYPPLY